MLTSLVKKLFVFATPLLFAAASVSAQQVIIVQPQGQYAASPCDFVAQEITLSIMEAERQGRHAEQTGRYQALRKNRQYADFAIPALLSQAMDMVMNGASPRDISDSTRIACNRQSRGY